MSLAAGTRLGAYEIVALIGSGGMGEVYRARDPRLGRDVAIKVLPSAFSADPDRLRRFEQEARAAAALNHPNILTVHEIGSTGGAPFVVSELLDGQTLRSALESARTGLPLKKVVEYGLQIVNGLAAAHERGIVHRDVKPENVFITRDDRVKILDFGLAKLREQAAAQTGIGGSLAATRTLDTAVGVVLGTVGYMSPEQVRGLDVDHRSDIFSFGAVLYEMLTGTRAFAAATSADTISAILNADPLEPSHHRASVPAALDRIVSHCLEKTPELRFQATRDLAFDLQSLSTLSSTTAIEKASPEPRPRLPYSIAAAAVLTVAVGIGAWRFAGAPASALAFRQVTFRHGAIAGARFTPDGRNIVYSASWEDTPTEIFTVPADQSGGRPLEVRNAVILSISRTGELLVLLEPRAVTQFLHPGTLARGSMTAGAPKAEIENIVDADYAPDGSSIALIRYLTDQRLCQLEFPPAHALFSDKWLSDLRVSPDGRHVAFIDHASSGDDRGTAMILGADGAKVAVGPLRSSQRGLAWSPKGDEIWVTSPFRDGVLRTLDLRGQSREVLSLPGRLYLHDVAADGRLLVESGSALQRMIVGSIGDGAERDLSWLDFSRLRGISDDGRMLVFDEEGQGGGREYRTFVRPTDGGPAIEVGPGYGLALSHDKKWTLSQRFADPQTELWLQPVGTGEPRRLTPPDLRPASEARFLPDDTHVVYSATAATAPGHLARIYIQALDGSAPRAISTEGVAGVLVSPDGKWIGARSPRGAMLVPADGGAAQPTQGIDRQEAPLGWTSDGQWYVANTASPGVTRIDIVNPWTGARKSWRELHPPRIVGLQAAMPLITPDGRFYAYRYHLDSADLFVASGGR